MTAPDLDLTPDATRHVLRAITAREPRPSAGHVHAILGQVAEWYHASAIWDLLMNDQVDLSVNDRGDVCLHLRQTPQA